MNYGRVGQIVLLYELLNGNPEKVFRIETPLLTLDTTTQETEVLLFSYIRQNFL